MTESVKHARVSQRLAVGYQQAVPEPVRRRPEAQRAAAPTDAEREVARLVGVCRTSSVMAVVAEVGDRRELLAAVSAACLRAGMAGAAEYLSYVEFPYD